MLKKSSRGRGFGKVLWGIIRLVVMIENRISKKRSTSVTTRFSRLQKSDREPKDEIENKQNESRRKENQSKNIKIL